MAWDIIDLGKFGEHWIVDGNEFLQISSFPCLDHFDVTYYNYKSTRAKWLPNCETYIGRFDNKDDAVKEAKSFMNAPLNSPF